MTVDWTYKQVWEMRDAYRIFLGKPLGRPTRRWEEDIKMDLQK
jgi:hypothetical protein